MHELAATVALKTFLSVSAVHLLPLVIACICCCSVCPCIGIGLCSKSCGSVVGNERAACIAHRPRPVIAEAATRAACIQRATGCRLKHLYTRASGGSPNAIAR